jgi:predicted transcriptional regulator
MIPEHLLSELEKISRDNAQILLSQIYLLILIHPGLHFREIQRRMDLGTGHLLYHLKRLCSLGFIRSDTDGRYLRYYTSKEIDEDEERIIEVARIDKMPMILSSLLRKRIMNFGEIAEEIGLPPSTTSWYLSKLLDGGIARKFSKGRKTFYTLNDPEHISQILNKNKLTI